MKIKEKKKLSKGFSRRILSLTLVAILFYTSTLTYINTLATNNETANEAVSEFLTAENGETSIVDGSDNPTPTNNENENSLTEEEIDAHLNFLKQQLEEADETAKNKEQNAVNALSGIIAEKSLFALVYLCEYYDVKEAPAFDAETKARVYSGQTVEIRGIEFIDGEFWYLVNFYLLNDNIDTEQEITDADFTLFSGYVESSFLAYSDELLLKWEAEHLVSWLNAVIHYENCLLLLENYLLMPEVVEEIDDQLLDEELELLDGFESFFMAASFADFSFAETGLMANSFSISSSPDIEQFPESYRPALYELKNKYPSWTFVRMNTVQDWAASVSGQLNPAHRSLIWDTATPAWVGAWYEGRWHIATSDAVSHIMDPRNNLTENYIFQYEQLTYNSSYHNHASMANILQGTFMSGLIPGDTRTYAQAFMTLGANNGISPYHLAGRVRQEHGTNGSALISGAYPGYEGLYNYFNIGASGQTTTQVIVNGLTRARNEGWTTRYRSLEGGSAFIGNSYIKRGQDTLYLQKFNVSNGVYSHQYMQNIQAPRSEAITTFNSYRNSLDNAFVFKIPVYNGMPDKAVPISGAENISQDPLSITDIPAAITYADQFSVGTKGGSGSGSVSYSSSNTNIATIDSITGAVLIVGTGTFTITATKASDEKYDSISTSINVTANPKTITIAGVTADSREYISTDTSLTLNGGTLTGVADSDLGDPAKLSFVLGSGQMADPNAGNNKPVLTDIKLTGTKAANYILVQPDLTVNILLPTQTDKIPAVVTAYAPTLGLLYGMVLGEPSAKATEGGDSFTFSYSGTLLNGDIYLPSKTKPTAPGIYTVTAVLESETHAGSGTSESFTIAKKNLTFSNGTVAAKVYDGGTFAEIVTLPVLNGIINDDNIKMETGTAAFSSANAGNSVTVVASGYSVLTTDDASNASDATSNASDAWKYNLPIGQPIFANAQITPRTITIDGVEAIDRPYDGTDKVVLTGGTLNDVLALDKDKARLDFALGYGIAQSDQTGTWAVTADIKLTGLASGNYLLTQPEGITVNITKADSPAGSDENENKDDKDDKDNKEPGPDPLPNEESGQSQKETPPLSTPGQSTPDQGTPGQNSTSNGSTSNGSTSNGSTSDGSTSNGSANNGSTSNGSMSNGSTGNGPNQAVAAAPPQTVIATPSPADRATVSEPQVIEGNQVIENIQVIENNEEKSEDESKNLETELAKVSHGENADYASENEPMYLTEDVTVLEDVRAASPALKRVPAIAALMGHKNFMQIVLAGVLTIMLGCGAAVVIKLKTGNK